MTVRCAPVRARPSRHGMAALCPGYRRAVALPPRRPAARDGRRM